jgi:hypothetical protein
MKPTIGRIVCYQDPDTNSVMPGIINSIESDGSLNITVFYKSGETSGRFSVKKMVAGPRDAEPGTWWWPERV